MAGHGEADVKSGIGSRSGEKADREGRLAREREAGRESRRNPQLELEQPERASAEGRRPEGNAPRLLMGRSSRLTAHRRRRGGVPRRQAGRRAAGRARVSVSKKVSEEGEPHGGYRTKRI